MISLSAAIRLPWWLPGMLLWLSSLTTQAQAPVWAWATSVGGSNSEQARAVATDATGNAYVTGYFTGTALFGATKLRARGSTDAFVACFAPDGTCRWAVSAGSVDDDEGRAIALDRAGDVYVGGTFTGDSVRCGAIRLRCHGANEVFVAKLDGRTGEWRWAQRAGGLGTEVLCGLAADRLGRVVIGGTFDGDSARFGPVRLTNAGGARRAPTVFLASLEGASGQWRWAAAGGCEVRPEALAVDGSGGVALAGTFVGATAHVGTFTLKNAKPHKTDGFVAKFDAVERVWFWAAQLGGGDEESVDGIAIDSSGDVVVVGRLGNGPVRFGNKTTLVNAGAEQTGDAYVAKLDGGDGTWRWATMMGGPADESISQVAVADHGTLVVLGTLSSRALRIGSTTLNATGQDDPDASRGFVAVLDGAAGQWRWAVDVGATDEAVARTLAVAHGGQIVVAGDLLADSNHFGDTPKLTRAGTAGADVFVAELSPASPKRNTPSASGAK